MGDRHEIQGMGYRAWGIGQGEEAQAGIPNSSGMDFRV